MVGGAVEADDGLQEFAGFATGDDLVHHAAVAQCQLDFRLVDDTGKFTGAQHRHGVYYDRTCLGGRQPAGDHGRVVGGADQYPVAGFHAIIFHQRMGKPVGPVGQFLVGALSAITDEGGMVAETSLDHFIGQFDADIDVVGVGVFFQQKVRLHFFWRQVFPRKIVRVSCRSQHHPPPNVCRAITTFCTSDAPS